MNEQQQRAVTAPVDSDIHPPFWARWSYKVAAAVLAAVLLAFGAYQSANAEWVGLTRRVDAIDSRVTVVEKGHEKIDKTIDELLTRAEYRIYHESQRDSLSEIRKELSSIRASLERAKP